MAESNIKLRVDARQAEQSLRRINSLVGKLGLALGAVDIGRRVFKGFTEANNAAAAVSTLGVNADKLKKQLLSLSAEQKGLTSQTELLAASYDVASAGFNSAAQATDVLRAASLGAVGGLSDLNTVANATTSVLNAYGLESSKAQKLVDGFIQTQNDGKIIVAQYASQIGRVAPTAAAAGVGIDELNAAISAVTATGVPVESTFAGIRQVIASVIKPSKEASDRAAELGIEFSTAAIRTKGFGGFLEDLIKKTGGSEVELSKLFGSVEALTALMPLINDDLEKFNNSLENQKNAFGVAKKAADTMGGTVSGQLKALVNNAGNLARTLDEGLGPAIQDSLKPLNQFLAQSVQLFTKVPPEVIKFTAKTVALTAAAVTLRKVMLLTFLAKLPRLLTVVRGKMVLIRLATLKLKAAMIGLKAALPFGAALIAVDLLVGKILEAKQAQEDYNESVRQSGRVATEAAIKELDAREKVLKVKQAELQGLGGHAGAVQRRQVNKELRVLSNERSGLFNRLFQISTNEAGQAFAEPPAKPLEIPVPVVTDPGSAGGKGKTDLERQQEAAADLLKNLKERTTLATALTSDEQKMLQLRINQANVEEDFSLLSTEIQGKLKEQYETLFAQENVTQALKDAAADRAKKEKEIAEAAAEQAKKLEELYQRVGTAIENGIVSGIMSAIDGTKSLQESLASVLRDVGSLFLQFGVRTGLNAISPSVFPMAEGGYVSGPTNALIGEGGEPEYVIPESKMRESMSRYSRGSRGSSVIPEVGGSGASSGGGGLAVAAPIDVRYTVERINSVDYVTADQFQNGMQQAATQGAKQGEQQTLKRLQMSSSARRRIGI